YGGIAPDVSAAQPALFQHGNVGYAMFLGEVVGSGEAVTACANDNHVVERLWLWVPPGRGPGFRSAEGVPRQAVDGIMTHACAASTLLAIATIGAGRGGARKP